MTARRAYSDTVHDPTTAYRSYESGAPDYRGDADSLETGVISSENLVPAKKRRFSIDVRGREEEGMVEWAVELFSSWQL